ncbi:helix-turn-helix transcriptional regulator [Devosia naphthalenivorans]|uniref:helix-turn-helix transcriptional regulator n=1 Tax=Devosia naphthalenivorans TaxID=2082392 RepID=UPI0013B04C6E|nr:hypothetical protein [Devosia naphthalenivorans]
MAAEVVGVSPTTFDRMVADGMMPNPRRIYSRRIWLRTEVEAAMHALVADGEEPEDDEWDFDFEPISAEERARTELTAWERTLLLSLYRRGGTAPASTLEGAGPVSRESLASRELIVDDGELLTLTAEGASLAKSANGGYSGSRVITLAESAPSMQKRKGPRAPKAPPPNENPSLDSPLLPFRFLETSEKKLKSKLGILELKVLRQLYPLDGAEIPIYDVIGAGESTRCLLYSRGYIEELGTRRHSWLAITDAGKEAYERSLK